MNVAGKRVALKLAGKLALRFIPGVGLLLTAYDLYQWMNNRETGVGIHHQCSHANVGSFLGLRRSSNFAHTHVACNSTGALIGATQFAAAVTPSAGLQYVTSYHRHTGFPDRYVTPLCTGPHPIGTPVSGVRPVPGTGKGFRPNQPWAEPQFDPWLDPSVPHPLHPPVAKGPLPRPLRPGRIGPRIPPGADPRDVDPGPIVGPRVRQPQPRRRRTRLPKPRLPPWMDPFPRPRVPVPQPISDPPTPFPGVVTAPIVGPAPAPGFGVAPLPPGRMPDWQWTLPHPQLGIAPRLRPRPPGPAPVTPPPPGMKERKVGMNALGYGWALWLFNFATESRDAVEALVKALPCEVQRSLKNRSPADKASAIYKHFDKLDVEAAFTELLLNHIEDFVIGRAHGAISKGFGSGKNWENYLRSVQASHLFSDAAKSGAKGLNRALDQFAKSLSLKRVQCGRR